ncbi:hypothetical protein [Actinomadura sp. B10D3]|uniref:hypothetical protein n=1 Tax=Actinomadura sp. B10D3 TaxID=3153557 RepID=UPI00325C5F44
MTILPGPGASRPVAHTGRWQLPSGRAAAGHVRSIVQNALHVWEPGPAAASLTDRLAPLLQDFVARTTARCRGSLVLRLELHAPTRLLLGEILQQTAGGPSGDDAADGEGGRGAHIAAIAVTYGRRPARGDAGAWYAHAFVWPSLPLSYG